MATTDELLQVFNERLASIQTDMVSKSNVETTVREMVTQMANDPQTVETFRKMRFGQDHEPRLAGSKFARWRLSIGDIEFAYDWLRALQDANPHKFKGPSEELTNAFNEISRALYMPMDKVREIDQKALDNEFSRIPVVWLPQEDQRLFHDGARLAKDGPWQETQAYQRALRAMDTAETGYGLQLIGAQYVSDLWEAARMQSLILPQINSFEMTAPTAYLPIEADIPEMLFVGESTASNSSNYTTSKTGSNRVQVDAKKFVIHQMWSAEMEEDAILPFVPFLRMQVIKSLSHYPDSALLNGDTTNAATGNINLDDADPADTKHYLAFDGIRHAALVDATGQGTNHSGAAITYNALVDLKDKLIDDTYLMNWGDPTDPADLLFVADPRTAHRIGRLDELINWKIQQGRTLVSMPGQVGEILGHPVISSIAMSRTEADGKVSTTGGNNTLGQVAAFNRRGFVVGWRRRVKMAMEPLPASDQMRMVHSLRLGFGRFSPTGAASGIKTVAVLYNISLA